MNTNAVEYELWIGTPNEMGDKPVAHGPSLPTAAKRAITRCNGDEELANKYDRAQLDRIRSVRAELKGLHTGSMQPGEVRSWQYPLIAVSVRIELRRIR